MATVHQQVTWTYDDLLSIWPLGMIFGVIRIQNATICDKKYILHNVVCKHLFRFQWSRQFTPCFLQCRVAHFSTTILMCLSVCFDFLVISITICVTQRSMFVKVDVVARGQWHEPLHPRASFADTVKPVYNDHLMGYLSAFWSSSRWPLVT